MAFEVPSHHLLQDDNAASAAATTPLSGCDDQPVSPLPSFSTSSSTSSLLSSTPSFVSTSTAASEATATTGSPAPSSPFPSLAPWSQPEEPSSLSRRSGSRPTPLTLKSSNKNVRSQFLPRTSSLSALPNIATIATTAVATAPATTTAAVGNRRTQSLADSRSPASEPAVLVTPCSATTSTLAPVAIRRKPLAAASPLATHSASSSQDLESDEDAYQDAFQESFQDDDGYRLPTPDTRFNRSCSVDSPTLYEFPDQTLKAHDTVMLAPTVYSKRSEPLSTTQSRNTTTPAGHQTDPATAPPTAALPYHVQGLTTTPPDSSPMRAAEPLEDEPLEDEPVDVQNRPESPDPAQARASADPAMPLFSRKPSPPHLSLGQTGQPNSLASLASSHLHDDAISPSTDTDSLYAAYHEVEVTDAVAVAVPVSHPATAVTAPYKPAPPSGAAPITTNLPRVDNNKPLPKSPVAKSPASSKLGNFFGWASASPSATEFSDHGFSPLPSPFPSQASPRKGATAAAAPHASSPTAIQAPRASSSFVHELNNSVFTSTDTRDLIAIPNIDLPSSPPSSSSNGSNPLGYCESYLQTPPTNGTPAPPSPLVFPSASVDLDEMEEELKAISAELAGSIRREMDLEDLVERLQTEISNNNSNNSSNNNNNNNRTSSGGSYHTLIKRSSDYFSDSGYSSTKLSEFDAAKEEVSQVQRRAEQEKAQLRLELNDKVAEERVRRRALDSQIKQLGERAARAEAAAAATQEQLQLSREVGTEAASASRRRQELEAACEDLRRRLAEERSVKDNFEDLLAAIKGELQTTANERDNLRDEVVPQLRARVEGLESEAAEHARQAYETSKMQQALERAGQHDRSLRLQSTGSGGGGGGLTRSNTVRPTESREALAERLKDVEAQRDALHRALKSLLERQEFQNRENDKRIAALELERARLVSAASSPASSRGSGGGGYHRKVAQLRDEVSVLRRRAEDALEQKWQVEKGLSGMKMDLDRAEEEIADLRQLLREKDVLAPAATASAESASASLATAYHSLQTAYAEALERVRVLEQQQQQPAAGSDKTALALARLEHALAATVSERDAARLAVAAQDAQLAQATAAEQAARAGESELAAELDAAAQRVEALAASVRAQLAANAALHARLADMAARGEATQQANKERIAGLEERLRVLADQLVASQNAADERLARHEEQVAALKDAHAGQLQRLRDVRQTTGAARTTSLARPGSSRVSASPSSPDEGQVAVLRERVIDLETALAAADREMQEVVGRMNTAQIEVMQLQEERELAVRETRRLQTALDTEQAQAFEARFRSLTTAA